MSSNESLHFDKSGRTDKRDRTPGSVVSTDLHELTHLTSNLARRGRSHQHAESHIHIDEYPNEPTWQRLEGRTQPCPRWCERDPGSLQWSWGNLVCSVATYLHVTQDVSTFFSLTIFADGFESGETSAWSKSEGHIQNPQKATPALPMFSRAPMPVRDTTSDEKHPQVRVVRDLEGLSPYASQWNDLASKAPQCMPTSSYAWVSAYLEHRVDEEERWVVLLAVDEGSLVGVLPLTASPHSVFGMRCPILHTPNDSHIAACDVVLATGREQEVFELLFNAATELFPSRVSIEIRGIPSTSATLRVAEVVEASLIKELARSGTYLPIEGSFEDYRASIRPGLRRNLKKAHNRLKELGNVEFEILAGESASQAGLDRFAKVEAASWKGMEGSAITRSQDLIDFYTTLTKRLSEAGWLHWGFLRMDDRDIAASLSMKLRGKLFMWKSGFDNEYRNMSPFNVLFEHLVQQAHSSSELDEVDAFSDVAWLDRWQASRRDYYKLTWYSRHPSSLTLGLLPHRMRSLLKRSLLLTGWARGLHGKVGAVITGPKKSRGKTR